jgi:hypothetical protein
MPHFNHVGFVGRLKFPNGSMCVVCAHSAQCLQKRIQDPRHHFALRSSWIIFAVPKLHQSPLRHLMITRDGSAERHHSVPSDHGEKSLTAVRTNPIIHDAAPVEASICLLGLENKDLLSQLPHDR